MSVSSSLKIYRAMYPAKTMVYGEYAVLFGEEALAITLPFYFHTTLEIGDASGFLLTVHSNRWDTARTFTLNELQSDSLAHNEELLEKALKEVIKKFGYKNKNYTLTLKCDFPYSGGFGSSSALLLGLFDVWSKSQGFSGLNLAEDAYQFQKNFQGFSSGYDVFTQYSQRPIFFSLSDSAAPSVQLVNERQSEWILKNISVFVHEEGASTPQTAKPFINTLLHNSELRATTISLARQLRVGWRESLDTRSFSSAIAATSTWRKHLGAFNLVPAEFKELEKVNGCDSVFSFKTTGSGGRDAMIAFGEIPNEFVIEANKLGWSLFYYSGGSRVSTFQE